MVKFVILALFVSVSRLYSVEPQYTRSRELPTLKLTFTEVDSALTKAFNLLSTANAQAPNKQYSRETLTIGADPDKVGVAGHAFPQNTRIPQAAYALSYSYTFDDAPVSSLRLDLDDHTRRLTVSGSSIDQVEAICATLERDLSDHSTTIGGSRFRDFSGFLLWTLLSPCLLISAAYCFIERRWRTLGMPIFALLALVLLFTLPFDKLLPGFAAYQGDSSLIVRFGPQISFLSLIISTVGISLSYFIPRWIDAARTKRA
jgi:hypothetical protein